MLANCHTASDVSFSSIEIVLMFPLLVVKLVKLNCPLLISPWASKSYPVSDTAKLGVSTKSIGGVSPAIENSI